MFDICSVLTISYLHSTFNTPRNTLNSIGLKSVRSPSTFNSQRLTTNKQTQNTNIKEQKETQKENAQRDIVNGKTKLKMQLQSCTTDYHTYNTHICKANSRKEAERQGCGTFLPLFFVLFLLPFCFWC